MLQVQSAQRQFLELSIAGTGKALYLPVDSVLTYEHVPKGKTEHFPDGGSFLRYDYGEGLSFAIVDQAIEQLINDIGTEGFVGLHMVDDSPIYIKDVLIQAIQEVDDEGVEATRLSINLGGQVGPVFVKESYEEIKAQRA